MPDVPSVLTDDQIPLETFLHQYKSVELYSDIEFALKLVSKSGLIITPRRNMLDKLVLGMHGDYYPVYDSKLKILFFLYKSGHPITMHALYALHTSRDVYVPAAADKYVQECYGWFVSSQGRWEITKGLEYIPSQFEELVFREFEEDII